MARWKSPTERHEFARGVTVGLVIGVLVGAATAIALVLAWASLTGTFLAGPTYTTSLVDGGGR